MKKALYLLILPLLIACGDYIAEEDRYIELPAIESKRNILIEDFTGQFCSNCPDAHLVISDLQHQYKGNVIPVAIHAGHFGIAEGSNPNFLGLMLPEGNTYAAHWGVEAYPAGVINRTSGVLKHTEWAAYVRQALAEEPAAAINVTGSFSPDSTRLYINTEVEAALSVNAKLQLWITESRITALQQKGGSLVADYQHHHVYRTSVNGLWGEELYLEAGGVSTLTHEVEVRENWEPENLSIVAFLYNDTDGVLQAAEHRFSEESLDGDETSDDNSNGTGTVEVEGLAFLCGSDTIANGTTYISSTLDESYLALGLIRFVPGIELVGDRDGAITVTVRSLNEAMIEICAFGGCQMTLPYLGYETSVSGDITAGSVIPLEIHYTPSGNGPHRAEALVSVCYNGEEDKVASFTLVMTNE